jgi:hypothetical protein
MYTVTFLPKFASEFGNFPQDQQDKILNFVSQFETYGLDNFSRYEGKIAPSWNNLNITDQNYLYCINNALWHYHIGIPEYQQRHSKYKTSVWVLYFQWPDRRAHINLVDIYTHEDAHGNFYIPPQAYLNED